MERLRSAQEPAAVKLDQAFCPFCEPVDLALAALRQPFILGKDVVAGVIATSKIAEDDDPALIYANGASPGSLFELEKRDRAFFPFGLRRVEVRLSLPLKKADKFWPDLKCFTFFPSRHSQYLGILGELEPNGWPFRWEIPGNQDEYSLLIPDMVEALQDLTVTFFSNSSPDRYGARSRGNEK